MWANSPAAVRTTRAPPRSRRREFPRTGRDSWEESCFLLLSREQPGHIRRHCMTHSIPRQHPPLFHHLVLTRGNICHFPMPGCVNSQRRKCVPLITYDSYSRVTTIPSLAARAFAKTLRAAFSGPSGSVIFGLKCVKSKEYAPAL